MLQDHELVEYLLEIADLMPEKDTWSERNMIIKPTKNNSQDYTPENCRLLGIPYFESFVDIDTYLSENKDILRIQGYFPMFHLDLIEWNSAQFRYFISLLKRVEKGSLIEIQTLTHKEPMLVVWSLKESISPF